MFSWFKRWWHTIPLITGTEVRLRKRNDQLNALLVTSQDQLKACNMAVLIYQKALLDIMNVGPGEVSSPEGAILLQKEIANQALQATGHTPR